MTSFLLKKPKLLCTGPFILTEFCLVDWTSLLLDVISTLLRSLFHLFLLISANVVLMAFILLFVGIFFPSRFVLAD